MRPFAGNFGKGLFCHGTLIGVLTLFVIASAMGCRRKDTSTAPPAEVRIGYFGNLTHAQAILGVSSGEFARAVQPSVLKPKVFNAGPGLIEALLAGEIDIGYVGPGPTINAHIKSRGEKVRVVAGAAANGVLIVARKGSNIHTFADLAGKVIATPQAR